MTCKTYYDILEVSQTATQEEIKKAFRRQAKIWHPDVHVGESKEVIASAEEIMKKITVAYEILSDLSLRQQYDIKLKKENRFNKTQVTSTPKTTSQYPWDTQNTRQREETEADCDGWLEKYFKRYYIKYNEHDKQNFIKYDIEILRILKEELINFNDDDIKGKGFVKNCR